MKLIDFKSQPGEASDIVVKYLTKILAQHNFNSKLAALFGDDMNSNFDEAERELVTFSGN